MNRAKDKQADVESIADIALKMLESPQNPFFSLGNPCQNEYSGSTYCAFCAGLTGDTKYPSEVNLLLEKLQGHFRI